MLLSLNLIASGVDSVQSLFPKTQDSRNFTVVHIVRENDLWIGLEQHEKTFTPMRPALNQTTVKKHVHEAT